MQNIVLLISKDIQLASLIRKRLTSNGITLIHADYPCLHEKLNQLGLILLDIRENLSNFEDCIDFIKRQSKRQKILVINSLKEITKSIYAMKSGAKDEILVPINLIDLITKVNKYLNKRQGFINKLVLLKDHFINTMIDVTFSEEELTLENPYYNLKETSPRQNHFVRINLASNPVISHSE